VAYAYQARHVPRDRRVLERPHRHRRGLIELAGEEQRPGTSGQSPGEQLTRVNPRQLDRASTIEHRLRHPPVDRGRTHQRYRRLDVAADPPRLPGTSHIGEREQPALLEPVAADQHRRCCRHRQLRMIDELVLRQRPHPAQ
jgi:hypothetical protein